MVVERDDLRWLCEDGCDDPQHFDPVSDADLAELGYVKVDPGVARLLDATWRMLSCGPANRRQPHD